MRAIGALALAMGLMAGTGVGLTSSALAADPAAKTTSAPEDAMRPQNAARSQLGRISGYLTPATMPSSLAIVPPPPAEGSAAMARDEEVNRYALSLQGSPRWHLASADAAIQFPALAETFTCALNAPISESQTPRLLNLLQRTFADAARSTSEAKRQYKRSRPFMANGKPICTPGHEEVLKMDGSYPSGHSAIGWAFGLVLSEISPDQTNALIARGREFGQSRALCNVHWQSDVAAGQLMGAAVVARMHAEPAFRADVEAARAELAELRSKAPAVTKDCKVEAQTLAVH